jgi:hypothetical protein
VENRSFRISLQVEILSDVKDAYKNRQSDRKKYLGALCVI